VRSSAALVVAPLALVAALLTLPPTTVGAQAGCRPLDVAGLAAQVIGTPVRTTAVDEPLRVALAEQAGTAVLFGAAIESAEQVRALVVAMDDAAPDGLPPLVAVDEEGGRVARLGRAGLVPHLPAARDLAAAGTPEDTRAAAAGLGRAMAALGIDLDLAPVLDLTVAPDDTIIGDRSFSGEAAVAGDHAAAFAAGLHDGGVATTGKHFPDHGLTTTDTHTAGAVVDITAEQLAGPHLEPYRRALPHLDAIMLSHLTVTGLDADRPVSLSAAAVAFLRQQLAVDGRPWDGVVVTDDLSMQAVADVADQPAAAVLAVAAGADLVLVGDVAADPAGPAALASPAGAGTIAASRVREAADRVLALKGRPASCAPAPGHYGRG
jgi:beta-N-acetylhexosaminidase